MHWVKRLSVEKSVGEPLDGQVVLGLNQVGWGAFSVRSKDFPDLAPGHSCRFYIGRSDKFTMLLLEGRISGIEPDRDGVTRFKVRQRCEVLEQVHALALTDCTALHVLQEIVEITGLTFATASPRDPAAQYLTTTIPTYASQGPLLNALNGLGPLFGVPDAVWYEQPDGKIFWGSWSETPMAKTPLPLQGNVIQEQDLQGRSIYIPLVGAIRPGMVMQSPDMTFRVDQLSLQGDRMRLEWREAQA